METRRPLGQLLVEMDKASKKQVKKAMKIQEKKPGMKLGEILVENGIISPQELTEVLAHQFDMPYVQLDSVEISKEAKETVPEDVVEEHNIVPVKKNGSVLTIAMSDPLDFNTLDNLRFILNCEVKCVLASEEDLNKTREKLYGSADSEFGSMVDELSEDNDTDELETREKDDLEELAEDDGAPVIRLVTLIISEAVKSGASDIHIEPMENKLRIRYRIDGVCREVDSPPKRLQGSIISRLKIMAGMDIAEKRKPQDGRIQLKLMGKRLDLRVSALPSTNGESLVMRILDKEEGLKDLAELGFHPQDQERFDRIIDRPNGIFLVTGPTGSGKTTTLYASLKKLNRPDVKIITAEDPVEYNITGINQAQVNHKIGMDFSTILKAMLRQAPNIILVGEIRDEETADSAIQAALTGHLVFSTLHTNDAPSALTRLIDIGVKPFLVASSVQAIMAQRLIRLLCPSCKQQYEPDEDELSAVGLSKKDIAGKKIYQPVGCEDCGSTGYSGRTAIFELLEMNSQLRELTFEQAPMAKLREQAELTNMTTLMQDGVRKILAGKSSIQEVIRVASREDIIY